MASAGAAALILAAYALFPGKSPCLDVSLSGRIRNVFSDLLHYAEMPAVGLGVHSIPSALRWAFPISALVLVLGGVAGFLTAKHLLISFREKLPKLNWTRYLLISAVLVMLVNLPLAISQHPDSPRVFTPTWLLLVILVAILGARLKWDRPALWGSLAGVFLAGALLSLALSSFVRVRTSDISKAAFAWIEDRVPSRGVVAVCGVERTMVNPAPTGDFSTHEFFNFSDGAFRYYTGKKAEFRRGGEYFQSRCPDLEGVDLVVEFDSLVELDRKR